MAVSVVMTKFAWIGFIVLLTVVPAAADEGWIWGCLEVWRHEKTSAELLLAGRQEREPPPVFGTCLRVRF